MRLLPNSYAPRSNYRARFATWIDCALRSTTHCPLSGGWSRCVFAEVAPTLQAFAQVLGAGSILARLRGLVTRYLPHLPIPFGFDPRRRSLDTADRRRQHQTGPDPPCAILEALA